MSKLRFILLIIIAILIIFLFPLALLDYFDAWIFFIIGAILFIIYYIVLRNEKVKLIKVSKIYLDKCDPALYIEEYKNILSKSIVSKKVKALNSITIALAYISLGKIDQAKRILDSLVDVEPNFDFVLQFWYYKAWIYYFEETEEIERIKVLIKQAKHLVDNCPLKYKAQLISNYNHIIARYYVLSKIHLNLAENEFSKVFKVNLPKFNVVVNVYYLGLIAFNQKDYNRALEYFSSVVKNGNKLGVVKKAQEYIEIIEKEIRN